MLFPPYHKGSRMPVYHLDDNEISRTAEWFLSVFGNPTRALAQLRVLRENFVGCPTFDDELARVEKNLRAELQRQKRPIAKRRNRCIL